MFCPFWVCCCCFFCGVAFMWSSFWVVLFSLPSLGVVRFERLPCAWWSFHHLCEQCTHKYITYRVAQHDHISSREHVWLKSWKAQGLHIFLSLKQLSSTCHVSFLAAPDTDHKHKFSLTYLTYLFRQSHQHTQDLRSTTLIYPAMVHGRVADQHQSHLSQLWKVQVMMCCFTMQSEVTLNTKS